jgi:hypothetical protein
MSDLGPSRYLLVCCRCPFLRPAGCHAPAEDRLISHILTGSRCWRRGWSCREHRVQLTTTLKEHILCKPTTWNPGRPAWPCSKHKFECLGTRRSLIPNRKSSPSTSEVRLRCARIPLQEHVSSLCAFAGTCAYSRHSRTVIESPQKRRSLSREAIAAATRSRKRTTGTGRRASETTTVCALETTHRLAKPK